LVIPATTAVAGDTCGAANDCALRPSEDHIYQVFVTATGIYTFSFCAAEGGAAAWDTVLHLGTTCCTADIDSNDDTCGLQSRLTAFLNPGVYWLAVEGFGAGDCGPYTLAINAVPAPCPLQIDGSFTAGDPTLDPRVVRDGIPSTCAAPKAFPGPFTDATAPYRYDTYTFQNNGPAVCVTVVREADPCDVDAFIVAYLNNFDPLNLAANYLADSGFSGPGVFSFVVPANQSFVLVAMESFGGGGDCNYRFQVIGLPCSRTNVTQKGSLLVWPEVTVRWNPGGALLRDTIITLGNDLASSGVSVKLFFVNGELPQPLFGPGAGSIEPGWNFFDNVIDLTHDEPTYWSSFTGRAGAVPVVSPFVALDPNGRPDGDAANPNAVRLRGFVLGFAVQGNLLRSFNHLFGSATVVDYVNNDAWEYAAWSFRANYAGTAASPTLFLSGGVAPANYDACPAFLLLDFFASGSAAFGPNAGGVPSTVDTRMTLLPMIHDFCPPLPPEPYMTDAQIDVWNEDEVKLTNQHRCIQCWDSTLLSVYNIHSPLQFWIPGGIVNHFVLANLGSNKGKARFQGVANVACDRLANPNASPPTPGLTSVSAPLLGTYSRFITWGAAGNAASGSTPSGLGERSDGRIEYCPQTDPPESNGPPVIGSLLGESLAPSTIESPGLDRGR